MTTVTIKLKLADPVLSKAAVLVDIGFIAQKIEALKGVEILEVSDDFTLPESKPVVAKVRKPRGPNKPKDKTPTIEPEHDAPGNADIPGFLKRT